MTVKHDPVHKPSQADEAHIVTAEYWREQRAATDRIAKLKAQRLAQDTCPYSKLQKPKKSWSFFGIQSFD